MYYFLHKKGYDFFTIPKLTYLEIDLLISVFSKHGKQKIKSAKAAERKAKIKRGRR